MNKYFELTSEQQILVITQVANKTGLPVQAIEKDLWVTTMLQIVFSLQMEKVTIRILSRVRFVLNIILCLIRNYRIFIQKYNLKLELVLFLSLLQKPR